jgi:hypothetical protein
MSVDRTSILEQLANKTISAEEAATLLRPAPRPDLTALHGRWLRIRVSELSTGKPRAAVNLPLSWVATGMQIGKRYSADVPEINWSEVVAAIQSGASGRLIEVEDIEDNQRVEIYVE